MPLSPKAPYPQLDTDERALAEVTSRGETAVLTQKRLVIASRAGESSTALAHIASLRVRYERLPRAIASGVLLAAAAALLFAIASPVRTFLLNQGASLEASARQGEAQGDAGLAPALARIAVSLADAARSIKLFAWIAAAAALVGLVRGVLGRTVVTVYAGGGELELVRAGRDRPIEAFMKEVGRKLPAPGGR